MQDQSSESLDRGAANASTRGGWLWEFVQQPIRESIQLQRQSLDEGTHGGRTLTVLVMAAALLTIRSYFFGYSDLDGDPNP